MCVKKLICLASFVLVLGPVVDVQAAVLNWTGAGADDLWSTPENWSTGAVPTAADKARIAAVPGATALPGATIVNEGAVALDSWIGTQQSGDLTVDGGTLTTSSFIVVARFASGEGTLNMKSGTITAGGTLHVGHTGVGTVNMTGGTINASNLYIPHLGEGHVNLHGGVINLTGNFLMKTPDTGLVGSLDVAGGTLIVDANNLQIIEGYIDNGLITAYERNGKNNGTLILDYNDVANQTTLTAIHYLNPFPADGGAVEAGAVELSWTLPDPCVPGELVPVDVYFTDDYDALKQFNDPVAIAAMRVVNEESVTSVGVQAQEKTRYYWAVDTHLGGADPNNNPKLGPIFSFYADNLPPKVEAGANAVTWLVDRAVDRTQ